ncbi:MAG: dihydroorotate dehydrogenase [Deltaproteobacteria bacterium]
MNNVITEVNIGKLKLKNPVMVSSGTFGYGREYAEFVDLNKLGAIVTKGTSVVPWKGNKPPRITEVYGGMINAIGLQNPGVHAFIKNDLPWLRKFDTKVIVNIIGKSVEDYIEVASILNKEDIDAVELNLSCPNVKEGCMAFGTTYAGVKEVTSKVREVYDGTLIVKLTPNVTSIEETATGAEDGGADAVSLINTILAMAIDINTRKPVIANNMGGLSGPAVKPIAVRMVYQASKAVKIPVIGMGGIMNAEDALEFIIAGASAVSVGTANFKNPMTSIEVIKGIEEYLINNKIGDINELTGSLVMN